MTRRQLHDLSQQSSARDGGTSGRQTNTEATVPVSPTIPEPSEAMVDLVDSLSETKRFRLDSGTTLPEFAAELIDDEGRPALIEAASFLDCDEYRDLHLRLLNAVDSLDDFAAVLKERGRS